MTNLNTFGQYLAGMLAWSKDQSAKRYPGNAKEAEMVHVASAGKTITAAYEQLRNAAEYAEENLLLQRAISRFYRRFFMARDEEVIREGADELILELTLAGYLQNDSIPVVLMPKINEMALEYYRAIDELPDELRGNANPWIIDVLAVKVERLIGDHSKQDGFTQFAYDYFYRNIDIGSAFEGSPDDYSLSLFMAVNHSLIKADAAIIRAGILSRYELSPSQKDEYIALNQQIDRLLTSKTTDRLIRYIDRRGGPLRILWRMIDTRDDVDALLARPTLFLSNYEDQVRDEYSRINRKIKQGITKSIAFLIITKLVIGVAIEVPYDQVVHGEILWIPLAINLFFPPVYMMILSMLLPMPGYANTTALSQSIDQMLYGKEPSKMVLRGGKRFSSAFNIAYALLFLIIFGGATWALIALGFSPLHLAIFFVFLSTASFLGFRLSRMVREVEVIDGDQSAMTVGRDIIYMPFVVVGHWISDKYGKMNIMTIVLDMAIELPLKSFLRLVRQWTAFISSKKDEL